MTPIRLNKETSLWLRSSLLKITDFGLAKHIEKDDEYANSVAGTHVYMAPKAFDRHYKNSVDIWSIRCIFYEMCMLKRAYQQFNPTQIAIGKVPEIDAKSSTGENWQALRFICMGTDMSISIRLWIHNCLMNSEVT